MGRWKIAQRRVQPRFVVDLLQEVFDGSTRLGQIAIFLSVDLFVLQCLDERFAPGRIYRADLEIAPRMFTRLAKTLTEESLPVRTEFVDRKTEVVIVEKALDPELLLRYEITVAKKIDRLLNGLERLQRARRGQPLPPPIKLEIA